MQSNFDLNFDSSHPQPPSDPRLSPHLTEIARFMAKQEKRIRRICSFNFKKKIEKMKDSHCTQVWELTNHISYLENLLSSHSIPFQKHQPQPQTSFSSLTTSNSSMFTTSTTCTTSSTTSISSTSSNSSNSSTSLISPPSSTSSSSSLSSSSSSSSSSQHQHPTSPKSKRRKRKEPPPFLIHPTVNPNIPLEVREYLINNPYQHPPLPPDLLEMLGEPPPKQ